MVLVGTPGPQPEDRANAIGGEVKPSPRVIQRRYLAALLSCVGGVLATSLWPSAADTEARLAELVDARDLKSLGSKELCRFESGSGHHFL